MNRISDLTRRLWAALLALCLVLALTLPVFAEGESGTADTAEKETFHIGTVDDLLQLVDSCRLDSWSKNRTVYLDADLELTGSGFAGIPSFSGVFEGQGHTISGLSLVDDGSVIGFFRYVQQGANVRDLVIRGRSMPTGSLNLLVYMPTLSLANTVSYNSLEQYKCDLIKDFPPIRVWGTIGFICAMWAVDLTGFKNSSAQLYVVSFHLRPCF